MEGKVFSFINIHQMALQKNQCLLDDEQVLHFHAQQMARERYIILLQNFNPNKYCYCFSKWSPGSNFGCEMAAGSHVG
jgi:hypothetical protein